MKIQLWEGAMSAECTCLPGCAALTPFTQTRTDSWLQYGLVPAPERRNVLYSALGRAAEGMLREDRAREFFFVHKSPGLRVRFQPVGDRRQLDADLEELLHGWRGDGLVDHWHGGAYEPEEYLFGGSLSMRSVHRVFTADSLAWLRFHSGSENGSDRPSEGPAWAMSLLMIRALLDALAIVGWEDLDVWDRLRWQAGRRLSDEARSRGAYARITASLRAGWAAPQALTSLLSTAARQVLEDYSSAVATAGRRWRDDYFTVGQPAIGPREAAAFGIVFHWNRARLSSLQQALISEALTARPGQVAR